MNDGQKKVVSVRSLVTEIAKDFEISDRQALQNVVEDILIFKEQPSVFPLDPGKHFPKDLPSWKDLSGHLDALFDATIQIQKSLEYKGVTEMLSIYDHDEKLPRIMEDACWLGTIVKSVEHRPPKQGNRPLPKWMDLAAVELAMFWRKHMGPAKANFHEGTHKRGNDFTKFACRILEEVGATSSNCETVLNRLYQD